ncbi:protein of unknown function [Azospirillum lipoferum 4B]|uniref:Uncharacterized protein n=1 Tax=Azospirillum lipoferum (strain 4B) TaxID=862719 RepID=G7Z9C8_AZOL4|nr:protein of unknown function [Azospirillum lipoferum 4B]
MSGIDSCVFSLEFLRIAYAIGLAVAFHSQQSYWLTDCRRGP